MNDDLNIDNLDNISFKPITEGLGFHNDIEEKKSEVKAIKKIEIEPKDNHALSNYFSTEEKVVDRGDLTPFYQSKENAIKVSVEEVLEKEVTLESTHHEISLNQYEVSKSVRLAAWVIDLTIVASLYFITFYSAISFVGQKVEMMMTLDFLFDSMPVALFYYIFYFSFLDRTNFSTVGKNILGFKLDQKSLSLKKTVARSIITLISLFTLGLGSLLLLQDKLTDTSVIKR